MKLKISKRLREAFRQYYQNRAQQGVIKWNKPRDIKNIEYALPKNCTGFEACAGTFWLHWKSPRVETVHSKKNYWCGKVIARRKKGKWIKEPGWPT